jgi:cytochrome P450
MPTTSPDIHFDPFSHTAGDDPYPAYRALREHAPVYLNAERNVWALSRYADVQAAARDWPTFASAPGVDFDSTGALLGAGSVIDYDPPRHDELRDVVRTRFSPRAVKDVAQLVERTVEDALDRVVDRGSADLAADFGWAVPLGVACELLGVDGADRSSFGQWLRGVVERTPGETQAPPRAVAAAGSLHEYLRAALKARRQTPANDLLTLMAEAEREGRLTHDETIGLSTLLCVALTETTSSLLSTGLLTLAAYPEQRQRLARDPTLTAAAVEEILRYEPPVHYLARTTKRPVELHDHVIPAGARVALLYGSANRDERRWEAPERFDISRAAKRHLAFGEGIHFCLGAPLARLEATIGFARFLERVPDYTITGPVERWFPTHGTRGIASLPARF